MALPVSAALQARVQAAAQQPSSAVSAERLQRVV
jgi:hypothetical protein